jgi:ribosomal RNA-processing protein 9
MTEDTFISGSQDGRLCLWKDSKKTPVASMIESHGLESASPRWISSVASIKASDTFASGSNDGFVRIWSTQNDKIKQVKAIPMTGFVNGLALSSRLLVAGCGREHRLGRWWNMRKCKDRLTIVRFPQDLSQLVSVDEDEEDDDSDIDSSSDVVGSEESDSDN